jgi:CRISPR-associated protein Cas5t
MRFIRIKAKGCLNSFRQPDFHTYHKTFPLPLKTTVGGMIGSALGISPEEVNNEWLLPDRFFMGIIGFNNGKANDLWQIRKNEGKQIKAFNDGKADAPYKTAVIVRELLYSMDFVLYLTFKEESDLDLIFDKMCNPAWALSLGREDELIRITTIDKIALEEQSDLFYHNTVLPLDLSETEYDIKIEDYGLLSDNLLNEAPQIVKVPIAFSYNNDTHERIAIKYHVFSFISSIQVHLPNDGYQDNDLGYSFQIF